MTDLVHVPRAVRVTGSVRLPERISSEPEPDPDVMRVDIYTPPKSKNPALVGQGACYIDGVKRRAAIEHIRRVPDYRSDYRLQPEPPQPEVEFRIDGEYVTWDVDLYVNDRLTLRWRPRDTPLAKVLGPSKHP